MSEKKNQPCAASAPYAGAPTKESDAGCDAPWFAEECHRRDCDNWPMFHFRTSRCPRDGEDKP